VTYLSHSLSFHSKEQIAPSNLGIKHLAFFKAKKLPGQNDKRIVFHCGSGVRSEKVARAAIAAGIERVAHMKGGFGAWKEAKQPYIGTNMASGAPEKMGA